MIGRLNISPEVALFSELGGKTSGYLPGYRLGSDVFARIGLTFGKNGFQKKTITAEDKMSQQNSNSSDKTIDQ